MFKIKVTGLLFLVFLSGCVPRPDASRPTTIVESKSSPNLGKCTVGLLMVEVPMVTDGSPSGSRKENLYVVSCPNATTTAKYQVGKTMQSVVSTSVNEATEMDDKVHAEIEEAQKSQAAKKRKEILSKLTDEEAVFVGVKK